VRLEAKEQLVAELDSLVDELRATGRKQQDALEEVCMWVLGVCVCMYIFT